MDEKATSSSRLGAIPVHSESRQPRTSSSSAICRSSRDRAFTCLLELRLQGIAVDPVVVALQLVHELVDLVDGVPRDDPERDRLAAPAVLLAGVQLRERRVRSWQRPGVLEGLALPLPPEHLEDQAASASTTERTHADCPRAPRLRSSRSWVFGPWPVTTWRSSAQSGSVYSQTSSSRLRSFGSGTVSPSSQICGT